MDGSTISETVSEAYRHCEALVRTQDKPRYLASLFAPAARRPYLFALYALDLETARARDVVREPIAGIIRLQWWHDALLGQRPGEAAASPVMIALQDAARATGIDLAPLAGAVEARQAELSGEPSNEAEVVIFIMAARLLGEGGDAIAAAAQQAAAAMAYSFDRGNAESARSAYTEFHASLETVPDAALPAFLIVASVPARLRGRDLSQWRWQVALLRAVWFGFPAI